MRSIQVGSAKNAITDSDTNRENNNIAAYAPRTFLLGCFHGRPWCKQHRGRTATTMSPWRQNHSGSSIGDHDTALCNVFEQKKSRQTVLLGKPLHRQLQFTNHNSAGFESLPSSQICSLNRKRTLPSRPRSVVSAQPCSNTLHARGCSCTRGVQKRAKIFHITRAHLCVLIHLSHLYATGKPNPFPLEFPFR